MNNKNTGQRRKPRFHPMGLIFYCYLLIPLNELAIKTMKINQLKIRKKIIDVSMVSMQNAGKGIFCHLDARRDLIEAWSRSLKSDFSELEMTKTVWLRPFYFESGYRIMSGRPRFVQILVAQPP